MNKTPTYIVERKYLVDRAEKLLLEKENLIFIDALATYGSGKSILLEQIKKRLEKRGDYQVVSIVISDSITDNFLRELDIDSPVDALQREIEGYIILLNIFIQKLNLASLQNFKVDAAMQMVKAVREAQEKKIEIGDTTISIGLSKLEKSDVVAHQVIINAGDEAGQRLEALRNYFTCSLTAEINKATSRKKVAILVDDYCYVISRKIGKWLAGLLNELENVVAIVARTPTQEKLEALLGDRKVEPLILEPFSKDEVREFLKKNMTLRQFENISDISRLVEVIYEFSHGHPGTVCLAADSITKHETREAMDKVIKLFEHILEVNREIKKDAQDDAPENIEAKLLLHNYDTLIQEILRDIKREDPDLELALHTACVLNNYDKDRLKSIISGLPEWKRPADQSVDSFFDELLGRLNMFTFVEHADDNPGQWHLQNFVRERLQIALKEKETERHKSIQIQACTYYKLHIDKVKEKEMKDLYAGNFILEDTVWQTWTKEWLYHLAELENRNDARLQFARAFFDAFNWWGWFLHFVYCDELLDVWQTCCQDAGDLELKEYLADFQSAYPPGSGDQSEGNWELVRTILNNLSILLELDDDPQTADEQVTLGYINWYRAESYWLCNDKDQKPDRAEKYYAKARKLFDTASGVEKAQSWNVAWTDSYLADLHATNDNFDDAINKAKDAQLRATTGDYKSFIKQDHELISQNDRVIGDALLSQGKIEKAVQAYACAIYRAFTFNFLPKSPPDEYTTRLYQNTCDLVLEALVGLWTENKAAALAGCQYLRNTVWEPFAKQDELSPIDFAQLFQDDRQIAAERLFPGVPTTDDNNFDDRVKTMKSLVSEDCREEFLDMERAVYA